MKAILAATASLALLLGAYVVADAQDVVPGPLTTRRVIPEPVPYPEPTAVPLSPVVGAPAPVGDLQGLIGTLGAGELSVSLVDLATGEVVGAAEPTTPRPPASSLKLLTAAAALEELGPSHALATTATWDGTTLTLVGGGDILLTAGDGADPGRASLTELAGQVAERLGEETVALAVDDTLFSGPVHAPDWGPIDRLFVMPMAALAVDAGRSDGQTLDADPALAAARLFAAELTAAGLTVAGPTRAPAPSGAEEVGRVESAPLAEVVRHTLKESDNSVAEALGRLVSLGRGGPGTAEGAAAAVTEVIAGLGLPMEGVVLRDVSGLSSGTTVTTELLTSVILASLDPERPRLHSLVPSLPVAFLDGTLADRVEDAAGRVRAKTGTLLTVASLTGVIRTDGGGAVAFSVILPEVADLQAARARLDEFVTLVASTGG